MRRSGEICGAYGGRVSHDIRDYEIEYSDDGNSCKYHRVTYVSQAFVENVKSSGTWIAVQGNDHICLVTLDVDGEMQDLFSTFAFLRVPEAIVSVIPDTDETQAGGDVVAISEYDEMRAINFLRKILTNSWDFSSGDIVLIAVIAFRHLLSWNILPNELKIFVAGKESGTTMSLPIERTKIFLDVCHGVAENKSIDIRSLSSAVSSFQDKGMGSLETSDSGHYRNANETRLHRRIFISDDGDSVATVESSETSWIAVQGQEVLCFVNCGTPLEKPDLMVLAKSFHSKAIVSVALGSNGMPGGSGTGVSIAEANEKSAVSFLSMNTSQSSTFTFKETVLTAIDAHRLLCPDISKAYWFEVYVLKKGEENFKVFPVRDMYTLGNCIYENEDSGSSQEVPSHMERTISYTRETQIWSDGWDSKLLYSFGFSWIAVQGKDSVCVVLQDEVGGGEISWKNVISHMIGNDLFGIDYYIDRWSKKSSLARPFAAVSVLVDSGEVNTASRAEIKAVEFLAKKLIEISDFTYETTVQTAISAFVCLTEVECLPKGIKACVFRKGEGPTTNIITELPVNEVEKHLRQGMMKPPKHLILPEEDSASSSKRTRQ